ncbi:MAG: segregation/condensation protein A [Bacilli bacterium]
MEYKFLINDFEGPLDLLLHLIKKNNVDICDIKISDITKQYLDYLEEMENLDLNIASEYLALAAELIEMKSLVLLPKPEFSDDEYEEDPRENLIKRLIEYKKIKESTPKLKELEEERKKLYTKVASNMKQYQDENQKPDFNDIDLDCLLNAFSKFLERKEEEKPLNTKITKKEYSVSKRSREIKSLLKTKQKINFEELFEIQTKEYIVVTFLSILALAKKQELIIKQDNNFSNIILSLRGCE